MKNLSPEVEEMLVKAAKGHPPEALQAMKEMYANGLIDVSVSNGETILTLTAKGKAEAESE